MNTHKNARMTVHGRALLVKRIEDEDWPVAEAARSAGISMRTAYKWLARFRAGGERMLAKVPGERYPDFRGREGETVLISWKEEDVQLLDA